MEMRSPDEIRRSRAAEKLRKQRQAVRIAIVAYVVSAVFIAVGVWGMARNRALEASNAAEAASLRTVVADVTRVEQKTERQKGLEAPRTVWEADLAYAVDGSSYVATITYDTEVKVGTRDALVVYRDADGEYRVPTITSESESRFSNLFMVLSLILGAAIALGTTFAFFGELRSALQKK